MNESKGGLTSEQTVRRLSWQNAPKRIIQNCTADDPWQQAAMQLAAKLRLSSHKFPCTCMLTSGHSHLLLHIEQATASLAWLYAFQSR
jgi:hypothetical protein